MLLWQSICYTLSGKRPKRMKNSESNDSSITTLQWYIVKAVSSSFGDGFALPTTDYLSISFVVVP